MNTKLKYIDSEASEGPWFHYFSIEPLLYQCCSFTLIPKGWTTKTCWTKHEACNQIVWLEGIVSPFVCQCLQFSTLILDNCLIMGDKTWTDNYWNFINKGHTNNNFISHGSGCREFKDQVAVRTSVWWLPMYPFLYCDYSLPPDKKWLGSLRPLS